METHLLFVASDVETRQKQRRGGQSTLSAGCPDWCEDSVSALLLISIQTQGDTADIDADAILKRSHSRRKLKSKAVNMQMQHECFAIAVYPKMDISTDS